MRRLSSSHGAGVSALAVLASLGACAVNQSVDLGHNVEAGTGGPSMDLLDGAVPDDGSLPLMSAAINATTGTICAGTCATLVATANGAAGPYSFTWGQDLGEGATKKVCPAATEMYSVTVGSASTEEQSTASATITVVACDGGAVPPPPSDGGQGTPVGTDSLCVPNPSFEGQTAIGMSGPPGVPATAAPPQWQVCQGTPDINPSVSLLPASDGKTYVGLAVEGMLASSTTEAIGTTLCQPLTAGSQYSFCLDLGLGVQGLMNPPNIPSPVLQIWGGSSPCSLDELLWTSPPITNADSWTRVCGGFVPSQRRTTIVLIPAQAGTPIGAGFSYVDIDHIVDGP
jgi:hypothetical protein